MTTGTLARIATFEPAAPERQVAEAELESWAAIAARLDGTAGVVAEWRASASMRSAALHAWAHALESRSGAVAELVAREVGKPITEASAEVARGVAIIRYYAQAAYDPIGEELPPATTGALRLHVERRPVGTVLAICPWNFPLAIPIWKTAPALAYGNQVVLRPSSKAIAVSRILAETAAQALPPGVLISWHGPTYAIFDAISDRRVAVVSFTGSEVHGKQTVRAAAESGKAVQAEMGGQNAAIVLDDADLDHAAATIANGAMAYAGQKCTATRRVIVDRAVAPRFMEALVDRVGALAVGDPLDPTTTVGPMISEAARHDALRILSTVPAGQVVIGNQAASPGWYLAPTLVRLDDPRHLVAQEEVFAPAAAILVAGDDREATAIANGTRFGLVGAVFGRDIQRATAVADRLETGMVRINASTTGVDLHAPFGGQRASSYGLREQGRAVRDFVTTTRTVSVGFVPVSTADRGQAG